MSISLPNGTILAAPSSSSAQVSAAVTRILHLTNFSPELKTRDIQAMFKDWEAEKGGFRIKWLDDTNALVVFADATVAKRAYLSFLLHPPAAFAPPATIRPYDRPDAAQIVQALAARAMGHRAALSSAFASEADPQARAISIANPGPGLAGFVMPTSSFPNQRLPRNSIASFAPASLANGTSAAFAPVSGRVGHARTGSASSSWARSGAGGGGVLNFSMPSTGAQRLPTHSESSSADRSRSTSSSGEGPLVLLESNAMALGSGLGGRRESLSADKALGEVKRALASVEARAVLGE